MLSAVTLNCSIILLLSDKIGFALQHNCRKQHFAIIVNEILRLNLDINEDIVARRKLMENIEISCGDAYLKKAMDYIKKQ